jgi:hypothetical protein
LKLLSAFLICNNFDGSTKMNAVYRYHAVQSDGWRFTFSKNPLLGEGWTHDGIAFFSATDENPNAVPIYQFHYDQSKTYGGWRFLFSTNMHPAKEGWTYDCVAFKAYLTPQPNTVPVYQYHYPQSDGWRFTLSTGDKPGHEGWVRDGISFYAQKGYV